jgi:hypothetical protein
MNKRMESEVGRAKEVVVFMADHAIEPQNARAEELVGDITAFVTEAEDEGGDQVEGLGDFRGGSATRRQLAAALQKRLREIGRTARSLPQDQYPGTREQFTVGRSLRYQQLIDVGHGFLAAIGPVKAAFVARAYPADFDEKLAAQIAAFATATQQKARGRQQRRGGTAGLKLTLQKAKDAIDELDSIVSVHYREANPTLLEVWNLAKRVQTPAYGTAPDPVPPPGSSPATLALTGGTKAKPPGAKPKAKSEPGDTDTIRADGDDDGAIPGSDAVEPRVGEMTGGSNNNGNHNTDPIGGIVG